MTTNNDAVFLAALAEDLSTTSLRSTSGRCPLRGGRRIEIHSPRSDGVRYAAGVAVKMACSLAADRVRDSESWGRLPGIPKVIATYEPTADRLLRAAGLDVDELDRRLDQLASIDHAVPSPTFDEWLSAAAAVYELVTGHVAHLTRRPEAAAPLRSIGRSLGRSTLILDARADRAADRRHGTQNPFDALGAPPATHRLLATEALALERATDDLRLTGVPGDSLCLGLLESTAQRLRGADRDRSRSVLAATAALALVPAAMCSTSDGIGTEPYPPPDPDRNRLLRCGDSLSDMWQRFLGTKAGRVFDCCCGGCP